MEKYKDNESSLVESVCRKYRVSPPRGWHKISWKWWEGVLLVVSQSSWHLVSGEEAWVSIAFYICLDLWIKSNAVFMKSSLESSQCLGSLSHFFPKRMVVRHPKMQNLNIRKTLVGSIRGGSVIQDMPQSLITSIQPPFKGHVEILVTEISTT